MVPHPEIIIHINNDMNINIHIDINMNIDITPPTPTPCRGRPQTGPGGHGTLHKCAECAVLKKPSNFEYYELINLIHLK